jgi:hypothetical protein
MPHVLKNPDFILKEGESAFLYVKNFKRATRAGIKTLLGVVVKKGAFKYLVSIHQKDLNNIVNKIKKVGDIIYPDRTKPSGGNHRLDSLSPTNQEKSSDISELAALEQSAAVDDFKAKFSDLVNS